MNDLRTKTEELAKWMGRVPLHWNDKINKLWYKCKDDPTRFGYFHPFFDANDALMVYFAMREERIFPRCGGVHVDDFENLEDVCETISEACYRAIQGGE